MTFFCFPIIFFLLFEFHWEWEKIVAAIDLKCFCLFKAEEEEEEENKFPNLSLSNKKLPLNLSTFIPKSDAREEL